MADWPLSFSTYNPLAIDPPKPSIIELSSANLWELVKLNIETYIRAHISLGTINFYLSIGFLYVILIYLTHLTHSLTTFSLTNGSLSANSILSYREAATFAWFQTIGNLSTKDWGMELHNYSQTMYTAQRTYQSVSPSSSRY
jgi:hypothetical protein